MNRLDSVSKCLNGVMRLLHHGSRFDNLFFLLPTTWSYTSLRVKRSRLSWGETCTSLPSLHLQWHLAFKRAIITCPKKETQTQIEQQVIQLDETTIRFVLRSSSWNSRCNRFTRFDTWRKWMSQARSRRGVWSMECVDSLAQCSGRAKRKRRECRNRCWTNQNRARWTSSAPVPDAWRQK